MPYPAMPMQGVTVDKAVAGAVDGALKEDGAVRESASEEVQCLTGWSHDV